MYSFGKTFSMTGIRAGFMIGDSYLIESVARVNTATMFCLYEPLQLALSDSLLTIEKQTEYESKEFNNYYEWLIHQYVQNRDIFVEAIRESQLDITCYIPKGGYFMVLDVSRL